MSGTTDSAADDKNRFEEHDELLEINKPRYKGKETTVGIEAALAKLADD